MKKVIFIALLFCLNQLKAQYVTIPDAKFAAWLQTNIPSAMSGNQMDTTNSNVTSYVSIDVAGDSISDLTGIQYFDSLQTLSCATNFLTSLPTLPSMLNGLFCDVNQLSSLPTLPNTLVTLLCNRNQLTSLPSLPNSITFLQCYDNLLTSLPPLPTSVGTFYCDGNQITSLPALPNGLTYLSCTQNLIDSLPTLPNTLNTLVVNNNLLNTLPALPVSITLLDCSVNPLSSGLPTLPDSLQAFYCYSSGLTSLPALPNTLTYFEAQGAHISCFPVFPSSLSNHNSVNITGNPFICLPNYVPAMDSVTRTFPLCTVGNANGCPASCAPTLTLTSNKYTICKGDSQLLVVSGAASYTWSPSSTLSYSIGANTYAKPNATTVYTVVGTGTNTTCGNSAPLTVTVTINTIQVNPAIICVGGTATLTASGVNTYTWSTGETMATITASPTVTTNYMVSGTDSANCIISDTTAITITTVSVLPPVLSGSNPMSVCQNAALTIQITPDSNSVAVWYVNSGMINQGNSYIPSTMLADTITYTVIDSSTIIGCSASISSALTFSLIVNPTPTLPNISDSSFIHCPNTTFSPIHATGSGAIIWYANSTTSQALYVGNAFTPDSLPLGTTYLFVKDSSLITGCINSGIDSIYVTINSMQVNNSSICSGGTATLTASGVNTYTWSTSETTATITASPTVMTNYTVSGTDAGNCLFTQVAQIYINPPATINPPVLSGSNPITICQGYGSSINVSPDSTSIPVWYVNNNLVNIGNSYTPSTLVADTILFTVIDSLTITGCGSVVSGPLTFSLIVNPAPTAPHITDTSAVYCQGKPIPPLHATGSDAIEWMVNGLPVYVGNTYTITNPPVGTTYYFALDSSITNSCFNAHADSIYITILPDSLPTVNFQLIPDSLPHVYSIDADYSANIISARWNWGDGTDTISLNPIHTYNSAGVYNICVTAFSACGDSVAYCQSDSVFRVSSNGTIISVHVVAIQTGIASVAAKSSVIKIYPNPAQNKITIDATDVMDIKLFDTLGKQITTTKENQVDASNLTNGVYFIQVQTKQTTSTQKIIVQH